MSIFSRKDWTGVYSEQNEILESLRGVKNIFLAGGTAIQRFVIKEQFRESEDLDFFIPFYDDEMIKQAEQDIVNAIRANPKLSIENMVNDTQSGVFRLFCSMEGTEELVKVELLNFTAERFEDKSFLTNELFEHIENPYNLILYKLKALCDRTDTIKDLFDLYFLFREYKHGPIAINKLIIDLELKFKNPTGYTYSLLEVAKALEYKNRMWDILLVEKNIPIHYIKEAIEIFREELLESLVGSDDKIELCYEGRIKKIINDSVSGEDYYGYIETNLFVSKHAISFIKGESF